MFKNAIKSNHCLYLIRFKCHSLGSDVFHCNYMDFSMEMERWPKAQAMVQLSYLLHLTFAPCLFLFIKVMLGPTSKAKSINFCLLFTIKLYSICCSIIISQKHQNILLVICLFRTILCIGRAFFNIMYKSNSTYN